MTHQYAAQMIDSRWAAEFVERMMYGTRMRDGTISCGARCRELQAGKDARFDNGDTGRDEVEDRVSADRAW